MVQVLGRTNMNPHFSYDSASVNFLIQVLKETENSQGKPQALYPLLRGNLDKLDETLVQILKDWTNQILFSVPSDEALMLASTLGNFGLLLQQCPFGDRAINLEIAMTACQQALKVFTPGIIPQRRAAIQSILGITYGDRIRGERAKNLELAIDYYQEALQVITPNISPGLWAATYNNLGKAYIDRIQGEPEDNLEMAISCFQNSLQFFTEDSFPVDWAMSQRNLGSAFCRRIQGDPAENYEQGIQCYQNALRVYTYPVFSQQWAETQKCLGTAYFYRILGDQEKNLELAISCYQNAIRIFTQNAFPENWANIQFLLGNAYRKCIRGEPASNFEQAIACYKKALQVYTQDIYPEQWEIIQKILEEENKAKNLEQVMPLHLIKSLGKAPTWRKAQWIVEQHKEELLDKKIDPFLQSLANNQQYERTGRKLEEIRAVLVRCREVGIAQAFEEKIAGVIAEEPERKRQQPDLDSINISAEQAVQLLTAMVTKDDIVTLWRTNPELAGIASNQEALMALLRRYPDLSVILGLQTSEFEIVEEDELVETPPDFQEEISQLQRVEVARGYRKPEARASGYPEHLSYQIKAYERILERLKSDEYPFFRASILLNLGATYLELPIGDRLYNLRQAIKYYQEALRLSTPDITPINYGLTLSTLGLAYSELSRISSESGVTQAIYYFREALQFLNPEIAPRGYGMTLTNLGELYRNLPGGLEDNLTQAIKFYKEALRVYKSETAPLKYALTQHNLGIAYGQLPTNRQKNLEQGIKCLKESLRFRTPALPLDYASTLHNLGVAYSELPEQSPDNLAQAVNYLQEAMRFRIPEIAPFECRMTAMLLGDLYCKQGELHSAYSTYDLARLAAEKLYHSAFIPVSQQREIETNAVLYDRLVNICLQLRDRDEADFARKALVYAEGDKARTFLDQMCQGNFPSPPGVPEHRLKEEQALLNQLHQKEQQLVSTNLSIPQIEQYAKERQDIRTQLEKFWDTLDREYPTAQEYINLRRAKSPTWEELTQLASRLGEEVALVEFYILEDKIAVFILRAGWEKPHIFVLPISRQVLRYSQNYQEFFEYYNLSQQEQKKKLAPKSGWLQFGKDLLEPLESALESARLVYFVPHDLLHVIPLHALTLQGEPFISHYAVAYAPSMAVLARTLQNALENRADASALVMGYEPRDNPDFLEEAKAVASQFGCHPYLASDANIHTLCEYAPNAHHIHLSCHGGFAVFYGKNPLDSSVELADGKFTARQWMELRLQTDLVTLSACQTGINEVGRGDEIVGLSRALLYAGASSVLLTLWSVYAESTKEWMLDFYQQTWSTTKGKLTAEAFAFQQATLELRKKYPNDPSRWAAFILVGDWR